MNNPPRIHHFIPQFWIKKFAAPDGGLWVFDKNDGRIRVRSSKRIMQLFNLYTVEPSGLDDTSLESVDLNSIDSQGAAIFDRVLSGDTSQAAKEQLADFFAAQIMRDPETVTRYNLKAQELALSILDIFGAPDYPTFSKNWSARFPGGRVDEHEFITIKSYPLNDAENALEQIVAELETTEGLPELPFTDIVRSPDGRNVVRDRLLKFDWTIKQCAGGLILGDTGVLFNKGDLGNLRVPLSNSAVLYLLPSYNHTSGIAFSTAETYEIENLNLESAARARRWLVGDKSLLQVLRQQMGGQL